MINFLLSSSSFLLLFLFSLCELSARLKTIKIDLALLLSLDTMSFGVDTFEGMNVSERSIKWRDGKSINQSIGDCFKRESDAFHI